MKHYITILIFFFFTWTGSLAQPVPGELIVHLKAEQNIHEWLSPSIEKGPDYNPNLRLIKSISNEMNIHLIGFGPQAGNNEYVPTYITDKEGIESIQLNYKVKTRDREIPDDPLFSNQWALEKIMAPEAWAITTGGVTPQNDTIVIAILDTGCEIDHDDLKENIWRNLKEIPADAIDNDNNGFIDDVFGWNFQNASGQHPSDFHGTAVSGIAGASGDNNLGISGINWHVKLMILTHGTDLSDILESYAYATMMRKRYNESGGEDGAFIVATNSSFGIDDARPSQFPVWCAMFDSLGKAGVLNTVAPANRDINVEVIGDMPSRCTSDFVIAVTNTNESDEKVLQAAWGKTSIDLGAPGQNSFTTINNNDYGSFGGTSSSAPLTAGAVALIYSLPLPELTEDAITDPESVAKQVKSLILQGVDPIPSLAGRSTSGGRLNVYQSMAIALGLEGFGENLNWISLYPNPTAGLLTLIFEVQGPLLQINLYSASGAKVRAFDIENGGLHFRRMELDLSGLPSGLYFLEARAEDMRETRKIIIH